jgi:lipoate-protein ligase B
LNTHKNNPETGIKQNQWLLIELPATEYIKAWDLQNSFVASRKEGVIDRDIVLLLEHPRVFTLGRRGSLKNLTVSEDFLEKAGIPVIHVDRGGDITYHGPGQIVMYPIIDLRAARLGVIDYVGLLEEVMIRTASDWGIEAGRNPLNRGTWVGNNKLGSIGIAIRRGVSFHGMAFNVNLSLEPFGWINPCGLQNIGMTSMERELSRKVSMDKVREAIKRHVEAIFSVELVISEFNKLRMASYYGIRKPDDG